jgi:hypothetical protein
MVCVDSSSRHILFLPSCTKMCLAFIRHIKLPWRRNKNSFCRLISFLWRSFALSLSISLSALSLFPSPFRCLSLYFPLRYLVSLSLVPSPFYYLFLCISLSVILSLFLYLPLRSAISFPLFPSPFSCFSFPLRSALSVSLFLSPLLSLCPLTARRTHYVVKIDDNIEGRVELWLFHSESL